ncbi:MAG: zinc-dependent alcohol dehydrogenase family protein [Flavobacteriaceae bacterium]
MRAAIYEQYGGPITIEQLRDPTPTDHGVVIKVEASGLCLSDWHGWMGHDKDIKLPHVPGHELAGSIAAVGRNVKKWKKDQRVTVPFVGGCGSCEYCSSGNQQVCDHQFQPGFTAWGSFAEYVAIDYADENLVTLPEAFDYISAASLGCRFITAYRGVRHQAQLQPGQFIAVHGCGGVGLSAIQIAKAMEAQVIAIDISDEKCEFTKALGADYTINANKESVVDAVKEISHGGVHVSVDALGSEITCLNSIQNLRKRGKHIQIGLMTAKDESPKIPMGEIIAKELEIIGSHGMQAHKYGEMFELISLKGIDLNQLIAQTISLEQLPLHLPIMDKHKTNGITVVSSF